VYRLLGVTVSVQLTITFSSNVDCFEKEKKKDTATNVITTKYRVGAAPSGSSRTVLPEMPLLYREDILEGEGDFLVSGYRRY